MKNLFYIFLSTCLISSVASANLRATFDYKQFLIPGEGMFLETHLSFDGATFVWAPIDSLSSQAKVQSTIILSRNGEVIDFRKTSISSSAQENDRIADFIDLQRFLVAPGEYDLEINLLDLNKEAVVPVTMRQKIAITLFQEAPCISSITFVEAYAQAKEPTELTKSGYDLLPLVADFFPPKADKIVFYAEVYNTDQYFPEGDKYLLTYALWSKDGALEETRKYLRKSTAAVTPMLEVMSIEALPEGNYELVIEVRTKENTEVVSEAISFFRAGEPANPFAGLPTDYASEAGFSFNNPDSMTFYIDCLYPIVGNIERGTIVNLVDQGGLEIQQNFFNNFWLNYAPEDPLGAWRKYINEVWYINEEYSTPVLPGYRTDRGRVWLQYGKPNTIVQRHNETEVFPYEIWHYYKIGRFNDKRFLFYSRSVTNYDFDLLHSDMLGEVQNEDWRSIMRTKNNDLRPSDSQLNRVDPRDTYSRDELEDLFFNPR